MSINAAVTVQSAIVHITDRNESKPVYSEIDLDLTANNGELRDYFNGQLRNALDDDTAGAKFSSSSPHDARDTCYRILDDEDELGPASKELARLLHKAMLTHARIAPGLLAGCVYMNTTNARHLALIKLDPSSGLVQ